jgi:hypothetical protein
MLVPFSKLTIVPEVHSLAGFCRALNVACESFAKYDWLRAAASVTAFPFINITGYVLEAANLTQNDQFTGNYSVRAMK